MNLISINLGEERILQRRDRVERTGIFKLPVAGPVRVTKLGLEGDVILSKRHHGGPDQAVYVYGGADYEWWSCETGAAIAPGTFGENLTIGELESAGFSVGDYLHINEATLQVTAPRIPCGTFSGRMRDSQWAKKFRRAERPGLYCRVVKEGTLRTGEPVVVERYEGETISIHEMFREYFNRQKGEEILRRHLVAPIAIRARRDVEKELRELRSRAEI